MAYFKKGGVLPDDYGLSLTVFVDKATMDNPVKAGTPLKLDPDGGEYAAKKCEDGDEVQLVTKHGVVDKDQPVGVYAYGFSRNNEFEYSGDAPSVGDSVVADGDGGVKVSADGDGNGEGNGTYVALVNESNKTVEVLFP